ncbi:MAG: GNAT family N-acetyltransferase [Microbacteriaceae bacterium]|nr:GNAT family N-acetyltransferase [Microbacteriaceae bacterium]
MSNAKSHGVVHVRPMSQAEFDAWQWSAIQHYASEVAHARRITLDLAQQIAEQSHQRLLPVGMETPGVHLVVGEDRNGETVGVLWLGPNPDGVGPAWVYNIEVIEPRRGEGWGRLLMGEAERIAREDGHSEIGLNVFGSNAVARGLYESLGYTAQSIQMCKLLST